MGKIAIIEDNKNIRVELAEYFGRNGFEIYCPDGEASEILDMIQKTLTLSFWISIWVKTAALICAGKSGEDQIFPSYL